MEYATIETLFTSTRRVPFGSFDGQILLAYLQMATKNGLDVRVDVSNPDDVKETFAEGAILLRSESLERRFLFLNVDAGRGFFGKQKTHVISYIGDLYKDEFQAGPSFKSLAVATTSINNIFRGVGVLNGPAL